MAVLTTGLTGNPLFNCILKRVWRPPQPRRKRVWLFSIQLYLQKQWPCHKALGIFKYGLVGMTKIPCKVRKLDTSGQLAFVKKISIGTSLEVQWLRISACQCRGHGFDPWSKKTPCAMEQASPCATAAEVCSRAREPQLLGLRPRAGLHQEEELPLAATRKACVNTATDRQTSTFLIKK